MNPQQTTFIYGLWDPRDYQLRYIGKSDNPERRLKEHITDAEHHVRNTYTIHWIRQLLREGLQPSLEILEEVSVDNWQEMEQVWIKDSKKIGINLTNNTNGGDGIHGYHHTLETKLIISQAGKNRKVSAETRQKLSEKNHWRGKDGWMKGKTFTDEHKRKITESHLGEKNPMFGKKQSEESIKKTVEKTKGLKRTEEFRKHISEVQKGKKFTEEHKQKLREAWLKRKQKFGDKGFTDESIEKMKQSQKKRRNK